MEFKSLKFSLGKVDDEGIFDGYASVSGVIDSYGDIVERGAFTKTLSEHDFFPVLDSHQTTVQLGIARLKEDKRGLKVERGELNMDVARAREVRSLMHQGAIRGLSIGYDTVKHERDRDHNRRLIEINLWEISPCTFQANPKALIGNIKSMADLSTALGMILTMDIKSIDKDQRDMAKKAIERIKTLMDENEPSIDTPLDQEPSPSLEPFIAAVNQFCEQIKIN
jgi:uncharacterized protein